MGERLRILHGKYSDTFLAESRITKSTRLGCFLLFDAPAAGFEPATNALHGIQYFRKGVDYIFTVSITSDEGRYSGI